MSITGGSGSSQAEEPSLSLSFVFVIGIVVGMCGMLMLLYFFQRYLVGFFPMFYLNCHMYRLADKLIPSGIRRDRAVLRGMPGSPLPVSESASTEITVRELRVCIP